MSKFANRRPWQHGYAWSASIRAQISKLAPADMLSVVAARNEQYNLALDGQPREVRCLALDMLDALARIVDEKPNETVVNAMVCASAMMLMASSPIDSAGHGLEWAAERLAEMSLRAPGRLPFAARVPGREP